MRAGQQMPKQLGVNRKAVVDDRRGGELADPGVGTAGPCQESVLVLKIGSSNVKRGVLCALRRNGEQRPEIDLVVLKGGFRAARMPHPFELDPLAPGRVVDQVYGQAGRGPVGRSDLERRHVLPTDGIDAILNRRMPCGPCEVSACDDQDGRAEADEKPLNLHQILVISLEITPV